jgi:hypothetical protein
MQASTTCQSRRRAMLAAAALAGLAVTPAVLAHADHTKPVHGGVFAEAGTFQGELVAKARSLTLHITLHGEPIPMAGGSAKAVLLAGKDKSELTFAPSGANRLAATAPAPLPAGTKAVVTVKLPDGRTGALRFELK